MFVSGFVLAALLQTTGEPSSFREGLALLERGELEKAERAFLEALAESPAHPPTSVALARLYARTERYPEAERVLEQSLEVHPGGIVLSNELGTLLLQTGRPLEAEALFRRVREQEPGNVRGLIGLAQSLADSGRPSEGIGVLEDAAANGVGSGEIFFFLGALRVREGSFSSALDDLARAEKLGIRSPGVDVFRGMALAGLEKTDEAESVLQGVLERHPDAVEARKQLGVLLAERRPLEARSHLNGALRALPRDPVALSAAGRVAYLLNRDGEALDLLSRAVSIDPSDAAALRTIGLVHFRRADSLKAREAFERALELDPRSAEAHYYLGALDEEALELEAAVEHYREAGSADSERALAGALAKLGRYGEALQALELAHELSSGPAFRADVRYLEASVHLERGDDEAAVRSLVAARELDPYHRKTRYLLGTTLARLGRTEEARRELEEFRALDAFEERKEKLELSILERPEDGDSYRPLIELYLDAGRKDEARNLIEKALLLAPGNPRLLELGERTR